MWVYKWVGVRIDESYFKADVILVKEDRGMFYDRYWIEFMDEKINKYNITSITPIPNPPKLLPVGTRVRVFEEYNNKYWKLEWLYSVYEQLDSQYALLWIADWQSYVVPARAVVPVLE